MAERRSPEGGCELRVLGGFDVRCEGRPLRVLGPAQRVLAFLGVNDRPLLRSYVAGVLWPATSRDRSMSSLRSALRSCGAALVKRSKLQISLSEQVAVDYRLSLQAAAAIHAGRCPAEEAAPALELLRGELLPDFADEWIEPFRWSHHQLRLSALELLVDQALRGGEVGLAFHAATEAVAAEPFRETAHLRLMRALVAQGNRAQAAQHYHELCASLEKELGLAPSFGFDAVAAI